MSREHINHADIANFAQDKVNLPQEKSKEYREQVKRLREKLDSYVADRPDFNIKKMILSGSLAKGTALRSLNDIDVACYIKGTNIFNIPELLQYLAARLCDAFPNFRSDQIQIQTYSIRVSFQGTGLNVDVVPIIYNDDPNWYGHLVSQEDGSFLKTNILFHLDFIRRRKQKCEIHFSQVIRLIKFWIRRMKAENSEFKFKSFMAELVLAHLLDKGLDFSDYPEALQHFFTYIARTSLQERIEFFDYYISSESKSFNESVQIIDPVNMDNNVGRLYTEEQAGIIANAALEAGDAIDAALLAPTKKETIYYWQKVFGSVFST